MTGISLKKAGAISLSKSASLSKLEFGLGWKIDPKVDADLDISIVCLNQHGKVISTDNDAFIGYVDGYGQNKKGTIVHSGDVKHGSFDGSDPNATCETVELDLIGLQDDKRIAQVAFVVSIYWEPKGKDNFKFGDVKQPFVYIKETKTNKEILRYELDEEFSHYNGVIVGKVNMLDKDLKFTAEGAGYESGLFEILSNLGLPVNYDD